MTTIDITDWEFRNVYSYEQTVKWMNDNIGSTKHFAGYSAVGNGWRIEHNGDTSKWMVYIDNEEKAILFLLRWK